MLTPAQALVSDFLSSPDTQRWVASALGYCARLSAAVAETHGFHEDERHVLLDLDEDHAAWLRSQLLQAEIARMGEELGEAIDNIRHDSPPDDKCPEFPGWHVELGADLIIRALDTLAKRGIQPGEIFVAKTLVNIQRSWKHGKTS